MGRVAVMIALSMVYDHTSENKAWYIEGFHPAMMVYYMLCVGHVAWCHYQLAVTQGRDTQAVAESALALAALLYVVQLSSASRCVVAMQLAQGYFMIRPMLQSVVTAGAVTEASLAAHRMDNTDCNYDDHDDDDGNDGLLGMSKCSRNRDRDGRGEKDSDSGSSVVEVQSFWSFTGHSKSVSSTDDFALHPSQNIKYSAHSNPNTNFTPPQGNPDASVHGTVSMGVCSDSDMNVLDVRVRMLVIAACLYAMTVPVCQFVICTREAFSLDLEPLAGRVGIEDFSRFQALNAFLMVYSKFGGVFLYVPLIWAGVNSSVRGMMSAGSHQFWAGGNGVCTCVWVYFVSIALLGFHDMLCGIRRMSPYEAAFIYVALCCILALLYFALSFWWAVILSHHRARHRITRTKFYGSSKIV
eukprot:TRINITY_DN116_c0_g1::TRINITY_DN116_c0_g1_i2::g.14237::m.14237 TRINITY_DN116_c0_g1::TRINITY_DN116_c0_g1_i2::g.14237  ORF type:complete len:430 (+),score=91.34 TRINITY_DN116_c0_g1_i2:56-1291(+)